MEAKLTKELVKELMALKGECRGVAFRTDAKYVLRKKGQTALKKVEKRLEQLDCPMDYEKIEAMRFYPIGLRVASLLAIKEALGLKDKDIEEMGREAPKVSLVIKLFAKFFFSIEETVRQAPKMWKKHYTVGELSAEADAEKDVAVIQLKDLNLHPVFCTYLTGYFSTIIQMIVNGPVTSKKTKCPFKNKKDKYHEYLLRW